MAPQRQLGIWILATLAAVTLLAVVLYQYHRRQEERFSTFLTGDPHLGAHLFEQKGCSYCHAVGKSGSKLGPNLALRRGPHSDLNQLVTAMWNHAPEMWERMRAERVVYPSFSNEEMAHVFAFLYALRYVDESGNVDRGHYLFQNKGCAACHGLEGRGSNAGPDLSKVGVDTPIAWAQSMWNHAPAMEARMKSAGVNWPRFDGQEMNDLLAYIQKVSQGPRREWDLFPANPDRGWKLFRSKGCMACHSIQGEGGGNGPELGPNRELPRTIVQFAGSMWNHSPGMWEAMKKQGVERPHFEGQEMADLIAFLYRLRYFESAGSQQIGRAVFARRGCSRCHGAAGEGASWGPSLQRHRGNFTSVSLATVLWQHGPKMYQHTRETGLPWPHLEANEVGDLVAFLNSQEEERK
jgi:cytochrome c2